MKNTNTIMLATTSGNKIEEYEHLFQSYPTLNCKNLSEIVSNASSLSFVEAHGKSYYENAYNKGRVAHMAAKYPTLSDDTGIEVDALSGKPGLFSHRYAIPRVGETQDIANNKKLLQELSGIPKDKRTARFVCTLVFFVEGVALTTTGTLEGTILESPRGGNGFGYDPIFLVKGTDKTLAEMALEEKNQVSHRAKAFHNMIALIKEKNLTLVKP